MHRLRNLLTRSRRDRGATSNDDDLQSLSSDPMPTRPIPRPRALSGLEPAVQSSPFFVRLPVELRQRIYDYAFTNATLHIDVRYSYASPSGPLHANLSEAVHPDRSTPKRWRWWSCVCHRYQLEKDGEVQTLDFWLDRCRTGAQVFCLLEELPREECFVGVMGWLRSCRQAYDETITRLYSTNTFYIGDVDGPYEESREHSLFQQLDTVLLPQRLAQIRKLELFWNLVSFAHAHPAEQTAFKNNLHILTTNFPGLQEVKLAVQTPRFTVQTAGAGVMANIVDPMDHVVLHFGEQLRLCELIVGNTHYDALREALGDEEAAEVKVKSTSFRKFHRRVGDGTAGYWVGYLPDYITAPQSHFSGI